MKKQDLKKLIKPLVKECIHEVLIEEGHLSDIVSEVAKGMNRQPLLESRSPKPSRRQEKEVEREKTQYTERRRRKLTEQRQQLADAIGRDAYNGVNLFEGTEPLRRGGKAGGDPEMPDVLGDDHRDSGVDISSLLGGATKVGKAIK